MHNAYLEMGSGWLSSSGQLRNRMMSTLSLPYGWNYRKTRTTDIRYFRRPPPWIASYPPYQTQLLHSTILSMILRKRHKKYGRLTSFGFHCGFFRCPRFNCADRFDWRRDIPLAFLECTAQKIFNGDGCIVIWSRSKQVVLMGIHAPRYLLIGADLTIWGLTIGEGSIWGLLWVHVQDKGCSVQGLLDSGGIHSRINVYGYYTYLCVWNYSRLNIAGVDIYIWSAEESAHCSSWESWIILYLACWPQPRDTENCELRLLFERGKAQSVCWVRCHNVGVCDSWDKM